MEVLLIPKKQRLNHLVRSLLESGRRVNVGYIVATFVFVVHQLLMAVEDAGLWFILYPVI